MIGDWVKSRGKIEQVREVYDGFICTDSFEDSHDYYFKPIPLTPKILKKNGFKFESPCINDNKDAWVYEWPHEKPNHTPHSFCLMSHHNKAEFPNFWICAPNNPEIVYVHQLQQALRLCGIEKEIEL